MNNRFHGKVYYMRLDTIEEVDYILDLFKRDPALKDEMFYVTVTKGEGYYINSKAKCGSFRGDKYHSWEKIKATIYRFRKRRGL